MPRSKTSAHVGVAVDVDGLAGHEIAVVGGEEDHGADEIGGVLFAVNGAALAPVGESMVPVNKYPLGRPSSP